MPGVASKITRARKPDFFAQMEAADQAKLEEFARSPKATIETVHEHLLAHGFTASESAVGRWMKRFRETDRLADASELADAIQRASAEAGTVDVAGGVNLQIAMRLQHALAKGGDELPIGELLKAAMAVNQVGSAEKRLKEMKRVAGEQFDKLKGEATRRALTPADIEAARKAAFGA